MREELDRKDALIQEMLEALKGLQVDGCACHFQRYPAMKRHMPYCIRVSAAVAKAGKWAI